MAGEDPLRPGETMETPETRKILTVEDRRLRFRLCGDLVRSSTPVRSLARSRQKSDIWRRRWTAG